MVVVCALGVWGWCWWDAGPSYQVLAGGGKGEVEGRWAQGKWCVMQHILNSVRT